MDVADYPKEKKEKKNGGRFSGLLFIAIGIIFLLNNFGLLSWSVWSYLWKLWPIFLIFGGLEMVFGGSWLGELVIGLFTFITIAFLVIQVIATNNQLFRNWIKQHIQWFPLTEKVIANPHRSFPDQFFDDSSSL